MNGTRQTNREATLVCISGTAETREQICSLFYSSVLMKQLLSKAVTVKLHQWSLLGKMTKKLTRVWNAYGDEWKWHRTIYAY